jgi:hypothetical protein
MDYGLTDLKREYFDRQNPVLNEIYGMGAGKYFSGLPGIHDTFTRCNFVVSCMDGGTPHGDIRLPGSGVLENYKVALGQLTRIAETARKEGKKLTLTSHSHCGAGKIKAAEIGKDPSEGDAVARKIITEWARTLGAAHYHIFESGMERHPDIHDERVLYVDAIRNFSPRELKGAPKGFALSCPQIPTIEGVKRYTDLALKIAMGPHGIGELTSPNQPFVVIPMAARKKILESMVGTLGPIVREHNRTAGQENIIIDGFVADV